VKRQQKLSQRLLTREELSRTLLMYGAFTAAGKMMAGDDRAMLRHLKKLRASLRDTDERAAAVDRVTRHLKALIASPSEA